MNCADAVERLSAALDGELPPAEVAAVERHRVTCEPCARRFRTLQQVRATIKRTAFAPVSGASFDARVLERVRVEPPRASLQFTPAWLATAAALLVAVSSAVLLVNDHTAPPQPVQLIVPPGLDAGASAPGWNEGRVFPGADCGLPGAAACIVEAAPGLAAAN